MIALNRKLPQTCFNCPCMATFAINKENIPNVQYLIRHCQATKQEMVVIEWDTSESIPDVWMNWEKPKWCPWQEINMAGFGGDY